MIIGVDFDNTIISYDSVFHKLASESGLIPSTVSKNKTAVRDFLERVVKKMPGRNFKAKHTDQASN